LNNQTRVAARILNEENKDIVSNGGMTLGYSAFGWLIEGTSEIARGRGKSEVPPELMQSFRAEGYEMLAVLRFVYITCKWQDKWPEKKKKIMIHCNNLSLVQWINWHFERITLTGSRHHIDHQPPPRKQLCQRNQAHQRAPRQENGSAQAS
jgi:hypothetical protein